MKMYNVQWKCTITISMTIQHFNTITGFASISIRPLGSTGCPCHCCLAPCKSVTNYGPLTEPKFCIVKCTLSQIPTSNGHISETKRAILDPLVPKFSSDQGLSPTLSWKWRRVTLSPSFGLFRAEKPGVPGVPHCPSLVRICPRACFPSRKKKFTW